jgi:hypothetical protein
MNQNRPSNWTDEFWANESEFSSLGSGVCASDDG